MAGLPELPLADTSDMAQLHQVFRNSLAAAPKLVATVAPGDAARAGFVANYYSNVLSLLHTHHEGEDELLTPRLLERRPEKAEVINRVGAQHVQVLDAIDAAEQAVATWQADPTEANRAAALECLVELDTGLTPHLDDEEREVVPIAAECINVAEWGELPTHGMQHFTGDKPWLIMGLIQDQLRPEQIAVMQEHMPPEVAAFWASTGRHLYADHQQELNSQ
jgi:hypothetical protein